MTEPWLLDHCRPGLGSSVTGSSTSNPRLAAAVFCMVLIVLFSVEIATLLWSTATTLSVLLPLIFMGSTILGNIPAVAVAVADFDQFLPDIAGGHVTQRNTGQGLLGPWNGLGVLAFWTALAAAGGYAVTNHRDV